MFPLVHEYFTGLFLRLSDMFPEDVDEVRDRRLNIPLTREGRIGKNAYYYTRKMSILGRQGKVL